MASLVVQVPVESGLNKRKQEDVAPVSSDGVISQPAAKMPKTEPSLGGMKPLKRDPSISRAREIRLEQNRKAARESRRRKKVMIEELQRSVIFFSRANGTLKQQNDELSRLSLQAQAQVSVIEGKPPGPSHLKAEISQQGNFQQAQAQAVATQAVYESQGYPAAAARAAAQTMNGSNTAAAPAPEPSNVVPSPSSNGQLPPMQPGATMQAMANFQQAAAAAMQAAVQGMQSIPGLSVQSLTATTPAGTNPQQAYNDTMTALAMQQAAAAAATGQQFFQHNPFMAHPMMAWNGQQVAAPAGQPHQTPAPPQVAPQP